MSKVEVLGRRLVIGVAVILLIGLSFLAFFSYFDGKRGMVRGMEERLTTLAETIDTSVQNMMVTGNAAIVPDWAKGIKNTKGLAIVQILRTDGTEAFSDNDTIRHVNQWLESDSFNEKPKTFFEADEEFKGFNVDPVPKGQFKRVAEGGSSTSFFEEVNGLSLFTYLAPIKNGDRCHACHGYDPGPVRAVMRLSVPIDEMEQELSHMLRGELLLAGITGIVIIGIFFLYAKRLTTELKEGEEKLRLSAKVFDNALEGIIITDTEGTIVSVNQAFTEVTGYRPEEAIGKNPRILKSGKHDPYYYQLMWNTLKETGQWVGEVQNRHRDGRIFTEHLSIVSIKDDHGNVRQYAGVFNDITERKRQEERIQYMAFHDNLTNLPNRRMFSDLVRVELAHAKRYNFLAAIMFMDLDGFKAINDTHGHDVGDLVLQTVAERIRDSLRDGDTVARLGGDEFTVLLPQLTEKKDVELVANKVIEILNRPMLIGERKLHIGTSIGISFFSEDGEDVEELMRNADSAMYRAKQGGKNRFVLYSSMAETQ